jgi:hypothetical protein
MPLLEVDLIDLEKNYDELREWMNNHGLSDHPLVGGLETYVIKKSDEIIAVIQERPVLAITAAVDTSLSPIHTYRVGQVLKSISGYRGGVNLFIVGSDSPSLDGISRLLEKVDGVFSL